MYLFLIPLLLGFASNLASAFTTTFSHWWGRAHASLVSSLLRNVLGIPVWTTGFVLAARTPSLELLPFMSIITILGWLFIVAGGMLILLALTTLRMRAFQPSLADTLASQGLYGYIRHPIHAGTLLEFLGLLLVLPRLNIALACGLGILWVLIQTRFEEIDLLQRLPNYREYMNRVPRFLPRFRIP